MENDLFTGTIKDWHGRTHYPYQLTIAKAILSGVDASQKGETIEIPIELPRQAGKTTTIVDLVEFILSLFQIDYGFPVKIGIFAPQREQASTDFDRLKTQFGEIGHLGFTTKIKSRADKRTGEVEIKGKWNSQTIRIYNVNGNYYGEVYIFPLSKTSRPESKTLDIIIIEEAQDADDKIVENSVYPMGAATNALRIMVGTAGTRNCNFKNQLDNSPRAIRVSLDQVFADRREVYEKTGDANHLKYEQYVRSEITKYGETSDYIQRQYYCKWIIGSGQFTTVDMLDALWGKHNFITENREDRKGRTIPCYVGIDTAKHPDETWVTVIRDHPADGERRSQLCNWLVLAGENYEDQFHIIKDWLSQYENIRGISIDSTGQGDFMPDMFENHTSYNVNRVKFTAESKDLLYKNLLQVIHNKLTEIPNEAMSDAMRKFRQQMLDLEKEYRGRFMSVHHPDDAKAHDDAPDSWALAEHAKSIALANTPNIAFI